MFRARGITLIEVMVALAVAAVLYALAAPVMTQWMADMRIRVAAETMQAGIQLARAEAIRRNAPVRFQLMSSLDENCVPSNTATHWVVSLDDATGECDADPSPDAAPRIVQKKSGDQGRAGQVVIGAKRGNAAATHIVYNGTGRLSGVTSIDTIDFSSPDGACQHSDDGGEFRCLSIVILRGGDSRMCDPKVTDAGDVRRCP